MAMFSHFLAMADMRGNLVAAVVVLAIGLVLLRMLSPNRGRAKSAIWIPIVALIAGPLLGIALWAFHVFVLTPENYIFPSDYLGLLTPILVIGTFVGVATALVFAFGYRVRRQRSE